MFMLTVSSKDFSRVDEARDGKTIKINVINDIISSTQHGVRSGNGSPHEMNRRVVQIAKALKAKSHAYYEGVGARLRCDSSLEPISVRVLAVHANGDDDCTFKAVVVKDLRM